jgi:SAM-dependent methyltransferase
MAQNICPVCRGNNEVSSGTSGLMHCRDCGVSHVTPIPTSEELDLRFNSYYGGRVDRLPELFVRNRDKVLSLLARRLSRRKGGGRILDVGCGSGYFLSHFFSSSEWQKWGSEICEETARLAEASGIRTTMGAFDDKAYEAASFDAVCILDTFYYFGDPLDTLRAIRRVLKPDGVLLIEVPFGPTRLVRIGTGSAPLDLFFYSPRPLIRLLKEALYNVEAVIPLPANAQNGRLRNFLYSIYSLGTRMLWSLSLHKWMTAPRFAVMASRGTA